MASSEPRPAWQLPCLLGAVLLACLAACTSSAHDGDPVVAAAEAFLADQRAGAWAAAYSRLHVGMQARCGSFERLRSVVEEAGELPQHWTLRAPEVRRYTALLTGEVRRADGSSSLLALAFDRVDGGWAITAWSTANRELCP